MDAGNSAYLTGSGIAVLPTAARAKLAHWLTVVEVFDDFHHLVAQKW